MSSQVRILSPPHLSRYDLVIYDVRFNVPKIVNRKSEIVNKIAGVAQLVER